MLLASTFESHAVTAKNFRFVNLIPGSFQVDVKAAVFKLFTHGPKGHA